MEHRRLSDTIEFPITDFDKSIVEIIPQMPPPARWPAFNSLRHLNRAWRIKDQDREMAMFRGITAEEEASTALFLSLKRLDYRNANKLNPYRHVHKNAVIPFVGAVSKLFAYHKNIFPKISLRINTERKIPLLQTEIQLPHPLTGKPAHVFPDPPLDFILSRPGQKNVPHDFSYQLKSVAQDVDAKDIIEHLKKRANRRNRLLYAESNGYRELSGNITSALKGFTRNVFTILKIYLMIDPYKQHQEFVQQCLDAFLKMLKIVPTDIRFD